MEFLEVRSSKNPDIPILECKTIEDTCLLGSLENKRVLIRMEKGTHLSIISQVGCYYKVVTSESVVGYLPRAKTKAIIDVYS